jgi:hypothetical protein
MVTKHDISIAVYSISILAISVIVFENMVQPVLTFIHPIFIDHKTSVPARGSVNSPAEWAWLATVAVLFLLSFVVWPVIKAVIMTVAEWVIDTCVPDNIRSSFSGNK